jgi:uncharacterized protein DUF6932
MPPVTPPVTPPDLPPLFPVGFHRLTIENVEQVCVDQFPLSTIRATIFGVLTTFVQTLEAAQIAGELWADGSYLTEKINPKDIDLVLRVDGALYNSGTPEQRQAIDWVIANQKLTLRCDSYAFFEYPPGDSLHDEGQWWYSYWHRQWGFSRESDLKGIVVLSLSAGSTP